MDKVFATIGRQNYKTDIFNTSGKVHLIADEPEALGGQECGFSPTELLCSSLAACTSITLKMYLDRKGWAYDDIKVTVSLESNKETGIHTFHRIVHVTGPLDEARKSRLLAIANACPVHKILSGKIETETVVEE